MSPNHPGHRTRVEPRNRRSHRRARQHRRAGDPTHRRHLSVTTIPVEILERRLSTITADEADRLAIERIRHHCDLQGGTFIENGNLCAKKKSAPAGTPPSKPKSSAPPPLKTMPLSWWLLSYFTDLLNPLAFLHCPAPLGLFFANRRRWISQSRQLQSRSSPTKLCQVYKTLSSLWIKGFHECWCCRANPKNGPAVTSCTIPHPPYRKVAAVLPMGNTTAASFAVIHGEGNLSVDPSSD
jgi:hypothetical protein